MWMGVVIWSRFFLDLLKGLGFDLLLPRSFESEGLI